MLEDNPYGLLRYEGEPLPTLYSLDAANSGRSGRSDFVIYLGTFSKILSPGIRLGWAVAPRPVLEKLNLGKQGADLCSSSMTQLFVARYFAEHDWRGYLEELKDLYRRRRDVMLQALAEHFGGSAHWTKPEGGLFVWATLPEYFDTTDLLRTVHEASRSCPAAPRTWTRPPRRLLLDATELRGAARGGDPRGDQADRQAHGSRYRPVRHIDRFPVRQPSPAARPTRPRADSDTSPTDKDAPRSGLAGPLRADDRRRQRR